MTKYSQTVVRAKYRPWYVLKYSETTIRVEIQCDCGTFRNTVRLRYEQKYIQFQLKFWRHDFLSAPTFKINLIKEHV